MQLKNFLCQAKVASSALKSMYPGPYTSTKMLLGTDGGIRDVDAGKGNSEGQCEIWLTQKKGDVTTVLIVLVRVNPRETASDFFARYRSQYPAYRSKQLVLGPAKGFTSYSGSELGVDCRAPKRGNTSNGSVGVSSQVVLPLHPAAGVDRDELATGAAALAADTARYVTSTVLQCSGPSLPKGAPAQKPVHER